VIPIVISPEPDRCLTWLDVGDYPFREWKFRESVAAAVTNRDDITAFTTDLSRLDRPEKLLKPLPIAGFIFHMSRCGSTLFAKALAGPAAHSDTAFYVAIYKAFFLATLNSSPEQHTFLNYRDLVPVNFAQILKVGFNYTPTAEALAVMQPQYSTSRRASGWPLESPGFNRPKIAYDCP